MAFDIQIASLAKPCQQNRPEPRVLPIGVIKWALEPVPI